VLGEAKNALVIPVNALGKRLPEEDNDQGKAYRVKVPGVGNEVRDKVIYIGLQTRRYAVVRDGLSAGDRVKLALKPSKSSAGQSRPPSMPRL